MAERQSKQPLTVTQLSLFEVNDSLRRIQEELDTLTGLRGTIKVYGSEHYHDDTGTVLHGWGVKP